MYRITIIGAGELGSRHLQGILKIRLPVRIEVLDVSPASLEQARTRALEVETNPAIQSVTYLSSMDELSDGIDICIVATSANVRRRIIEELLTKRSVKNLVLEKVLFQRVSDYQFMQNILAEKKINTWVNCPRRMMPVYKEIKKNILTGEKLTFTVIGGNWGLACNTIHFMDTLCFLNENETFELNTSGLGEIISAKRPGFYELPGTLTGRQSNGSDLFLHARGTNTACTSIQILSERFFWQIDEMKGVLSTASAATNWIPEISRFSMPYQSQLSASLCEDILINNSCELPGFETSASLHQTMITAFLEVFNRGAQTITDVCPIT